MLDHIDIDEVNALAGLTQRPYVGRHRKPPYRSGGIVLSTGSVA